MTTITTNLYVATTRVVDENDDAAVSVFRVISSDIDAVCDYISEKMFTDYPPDQGWVEHGMAVIPVMLSIETPDRERVCGVLPGGAKMFEGIELTKRNEGGSVYHAPQ